MRPDQEWRRLLLGISLASPAVLAGVYGRSRARVDALPPSGVPGSEHLARVWVQRAAEAAADARYGDALEALRLAAAWRCDRYEHEGDPDPWAEVPEQLADLRELGPSEVEGLRAMVARLTEEVARAREEGRAEERAAWVRGERCAHLPKPEEAP